MRTLHGVLGAFAAVAVCLSAHAQQQRGGDQKARQAESKSQETPGIDRGAAIAHALCMTIEGNGLWECAQKAGATAGTGGATPGQEGGASASLMKHAQEAFQSSDRLFEAVAKEKRQGAGKDDQTCEEFYRAAREYSRALQAYSKQNGGGSQVAGRTGVDAQVNRAGTATRGATAGGADSARIALVNHAVKEAVGGVGIKKMLEAHQEKGEAAKALEEHAKEMMTSSEQAIAAAQGRTGQTQGQPTPGRTGQPQAQPGRGRAGQDNDDRQGAQGASSVEDLVRLAQEVIRTVKALDDSGQGRRAGE